MADLQKTRTEPIQQFWDMTDDVRAGMLGVTGSRQHMQPMHPNCDRAGRTIWFFVKLDSEIVEAVGQGGHGHFCVVGRSNDYHACVAGKLTVERNQAIIDRFWSSVAAAWFTGKDDPNMTLLKLALDDGVAWASVGPIAFGWEILKANMSSNKEPDVGVRQHFSFLHAPSTGAENSARRPAMPGQAAGAARQDGQV